MKTQTEVKTKFNKHAAICTQCDEAEYYDEACVIGKNLWKEYEYTLFN